MGVTLGTYGDNGSTGWTSISPTPDTNFISWAHQQGNTYPSGGDIGDGTRFVFVDSSAANDSGDGSLATPKKNVNGVNGGVAQLRNGSPDWLLLKKGGTWTDQTFEINPTDNFIGGGKSATEPMVIAAYDPNASMNPPVPNPSTGGARPLFKTANGDSALSYLGAQRGHFLALMGIEFYAYQRDPGNLSFNQAVFTGHITLTTLTVESLTSGTIIVGQEVCCAGIASNTTIVSGSGATWQVSVSQTIANGTAMACAFEPDCISGKNSFDWQLIEDCKFSFYHFNISYNNQSGVNAGPIYIRRNVIQNAWCQDVGHSVGLYLELITNPTIEENVIAKNGYNNSVQFGEATSLSRNVYLQATTTGVTARGNTNVYSASEGFQFRTGGTIYDNLCMLNITGFDVGHTETAPTTTAANVYNNVITQSVDLGATPHGQGIQVYRASGTGVNIHNNIITTDAVSGVNASWINLNNEVTGILVTNNIAFSWPLDFSDSGTGNQFSGNTWCSGGLGTCTPAASYPDPTRTIASYAGTIGLTASNDGFINAVLTQSKATWQANYTAQFANNYIRAGFGISGGTTSTKRKKHIVVHQ